MGRGKMARRRLPEEAAELVVDCGLPLELMDRAGDGPTTGGDGVLAEMMDGVLMVQECYWACQRTSWTWETVRVECAGHGEVGSGQTGRTDSVHPQSIRSRPYLLCRLSRRVCR